MKERTIELTRRYRTALRIHLREGGATTLRPALQLGRRALRLGLDTLDLARIHRDSVTGPGSPRQTVVASKRGSRFFNEALVCIVETHRAARGGRLRLARLNKTLRQRTAELAVKNGQLKRGIVRRKRVQASLRKSTRHFESRLKESLQLQKGLRRLTHRVLASQEDERKRTSLELQNEVAQTLLGIHVRLLTLKQEEKSNITGLNNNIASTQLLVAKFAQSMRKAAGKLGNS